jgi:DNA N-6-adenine-methyltransferase (Dam)
MQQAQGTKEVDYIKSENWHEAAKLFPLLSEEGLSELAEDIKANGLLNSVVLFEGKVLDGRNRTIACKAANTTPTFIEWKESGSPTSWVISQNLHRRHLTASQKAVIALEAEPLFAEEAKERQKLGKQKVADPTIKGQARDKAAVSVGVNRQYVSDAKRIQAKAPELIAKIKSGEITIPEAKKQLGFKQSTRLMVSAESNEWYTPRNYVEAARKVLGEIELDPASCESANKKVVKATKFYTEEDDGLKQNWYGKVFLNPPYGDVGPQFVARLVKEYEAGNVDEAILLLNSHVTDSKWFQPLFDYILCFTDHRSKFWNEENPEGTSTSPTHGSVFVYFGKNSKVFEKHFKQFGAVLQRYIPRAPQQVATAYRPSRQSDRGSEDASGTSIAA